MKERSDFVIACDIDEVLFPYLPAWIDFYNRTHETAVKVSDFHSYNFSRVLVQHDEEYISNVVYDFHNSPEFLEVEPIDGSVTAVRKLQEMGDVHFVTSRQQVIAQQTHDWIYRYFGINHDKIHIGNHWCKETDAVTSKKTKAEMCRLIGARVLIDDSVSYIKECAREGMMALLFDFNGSYGWSKLKPDDDGDERVTRVTSWQDTIRVIQGIKEATSNMQHA